MSTIRLIQVEGLSQLREQSRAWDDLWRRSEVSLPTCRAEPLAIWLEHFAPKQRFVAVGVEYEGQLVAALPLVASRRHGVKVLELPGNCWAESGDLLLDPMTACDTDEVLDLLLRGVRTLRRPLLWLEGIEAQADRWRDFRAALERADAEPVLRPQYHVGVIDIDHDWDAYQAAWSGSHRAAVRKGMRKLSERGEVRLVQRRQLDADEIEPLLKQAFEIEDRSWKGQAGSSILRTEGMCEFFVRQAQVLASQGELELDLLELSGEAIAFELCYRGKGTLYSHKIGYNDDYAKFGPGRLLRALQLEVAFNDRELNCFDTMGIYDRSKGDWSNRAYPVSRLVAPTGAWGGWAWTAAYRRLGALKRKWRGGSDTLEPVKLGAAKKGASGSRQAAECAVAK